MNTLDILLIIPLTYGLISGLTKGFVKEIGSLLGIILGLYAARFFAPEVTYWLTSWLNTSAQITLLIAYALIFLTVSIGLNILAYMLTKLLQVIHIGWINRMAGALLGTLKITIVLSVILNFIAIINNHITIIEQETKENSLLYTPVEKSIGIILPFLSYDQFIKTFNELKQ